MYTRQIINVGNLPNDGTGDPLRVAFNKINDNFSNLFTTFVNSTVANTTGTATQVIFQTPANTFTQGQFYIQSESTTNHDSQTITLSAQINNDPSTITFTAYGTTTIGNAVSSFDMNYDSFSGNIRILATPLTTGTLTHLISSQIMWAG